MSACVPLKLALDRDIIVNMLKIRAIYPLIATRRRIPWRKTGRAQEWFKWSQQKRNEEAKKLLAEAGFTADAS